MTTIVLNGKKYVINDNDTALISIDDYREEVQELKAELNWWGNLVEVNNIGKPEAKCPNLKAYIDKLQAENKRLREALARYGRHYRLPRCNWFYIGKECNCGFEQALKEGGE